MVGIIVNIVCVVIGGLVGTAVGRRLSASLTAKLNAVFGVCALGMGISSITLMQNMPAVILAVIVGTVAGSAVHLGELINRGGAQLQKPVARLLGGTGPLPQEERNSLLVTTLVLFCSSGTGIYGCLDAGMTGNPTILLSKSVLDFFTALIFACSLGAVTALVAIPQTVIFLALFFLARLIVPLTTGGMIADFKACGGFLLVATGLRMAKIKEFPIADMIPAMALVMTFSWLWTEYVVPLL